MSTTAPVGRAQHAQAVHESWTLRLAGSSRPASPGVMEHAPTQLGVGPSRRAVDTACLKTASRALAVDAAIARHAPPQCARRSMAPIPRAGVAVRLGTA